MVPGSAGTCHGWMMVAIFRTGFPLFQYSVAVLTCCYNRVFLRAVDAVIASYNMKIWKYMRMNDVWYLMSLSEDAVLTSRG